MRGFSCHGGTYLLNLQSLGQSYERFGPPPKPAPLTSQNMKKTTQKHRTSILSFVFCVQVLNRNATFCFSLLHSLGPRTAARGCMTDDLHASAQFRPRCWSCCIRSSARFAAGSCSHTSSAFSWEKSRRLGFRHRGAFRNPSGHLFLGVDGQKRARGCQRKCLVRKGNSDRGPFSTSILVSRRVTFLRDVGEAASKAAKQPKSMITASG